MQIQLVFLFSIFIKFTDKKITGEALATIEKSDIKELGVQPIGRCIALMAKISELFNTSQQDKHSDVVNKSENDIVMKKKNKS